MGILGTMEVDLELAGHPDSVSEARRAVSELGDSIPSGRLDDLRLLVSEVVTNAIRHAEMGPQDRVGLRIVAFDDAVRVEVRDRGHGFAPGERAPDPARASGWGLYLVAELADRWGIEGESQTCVWFEMR